VIAWLFVVGFIGMKKILLIAGALLLVGCGPSQKDKDIAAAACSEIMGTLKSEEAKRIKIYNDARLELDMRPITSSDSKFFFDINVRYGGFDSCMDTFFPPPPPTKAELEAQEEARKAAEEAEAARELAKKAEEEEAARKAEEERQYIAENTKTSYLSCPSLTQIKRKECISCERIKPKCPGILGVIISDWTEGVLIAAFSYESAGKDAGLETGDEIIQVNDYDIENVADFLKSMASLKSNETVDIKVIKRFESRMVQTIPVTLGVTDNCPRVDDWWEEPVGSRSYAYIELNKVDGDNPDKNKLLPSRVHFNIPNTLEFHKSQSNSDGEPILGYQRIESQLDEMRRIGIDNNCKWSGKKCMYGRSGVEKINNDDIGGYGSHERCDSSNLTRVEFEDFTFCIGGAYYRQPYVHIYKEGRSAFPEYKIKESSSYGNEVITIGDFIIDRVNLRANDDADDGYLGRLNMDYQCEVVTKETFDEKIQEAKTRVQAAVDGYKAEKAAELAERDEEPQI